MYDENNKNEFGYMNPDEHAEVSKQEENIVSQTAHQDIQDQELSETQTVLSRQNESSEQISSQPEKQSEAASEVNFVLQDSAKSEPVQPGQADQPSQMNQAVQPGQINQPSQMNRTVQPEQANQPSQINRTPQPERMSQPAQGASSYRPQADGYNQAAGYQQRMGTENRNPSGGGQYNGQACQRQEQSRYSQNPQIPNGYYQGPYASGPVYSQIPPEPKKKPGKKHSVAGKIAGITAAALLFGTVSGGTMVGINVLSDRFLAKPVQTETQPVTLGKAETEAETQKKETTAQASQAIVTDVSAIVEQAMPSVVAINNTMLYKTNSWFGPSQTYEVPSSGSGIIVGKNDEELLIVTNNHVVADSNNLSVAFIDDQSVEATIKGTDADSDLAVVAVPLSSIPAETLSQISAIKIGDSDSLKVGQGVIAIGNALGYGQSVTVGYVSALNREVKTDDSSTRNLLQTDAAINPGNSGGALLNMQGELIGINAAKYSSTEVEGMGYAIPISQASDIINELMNRETRNAVEESKQGYLGIQGKNIDETAAKEFGMPKGVYVYKILDDGAAAKSSLREKDIITKFDGQSVRSMADLQELLTYYEGGETVTMTVQSLENGQYEEHSVDVTLGFRPQVETSK